MSDCNVCLVAYDGDPCDVWRQEWPVARKEYKCIECDRPIPIGARYQKVTMLFEGDWSTCRTCSVCAEIRHVFYCDGGEVIGNFWDEMWEYGFPEVTQSGDCLKRLKTPEARRYFAERYRNWAELHA